MRKTRYIKFSSNIIKIIFVENQYSLALKFLLQHPFLQYPQLKEANRDYATFGCVLTTDDLDVVLDIAATKTMDIGYGFSDFPEDIIRIKAIIRAN